MARLYVVQAQPNPPGRDTVSPGRATNDQLNREWVELEAIEGNRDVAGDEVLQLTFSPRCEVTGSDVLIKFGSGTLNQGNRIRLHTGSGTAGWEGNIFLMYLGRGWYIWNNRCGDRVTTRNAGTIQDSAGYAPNPPEGVLVRVAGTDRLVPAHLAAYR